MGVKPSRQKTKQGKNTLILMLLIKSHHFYRVKDIICFYINIKNQDICALRLMVWFFVTRTFRLCARSVVSQCMELGNHYATLIATMECDFKN